MRHGQWLGQLVQGAAAHRTIWASRAAILLVALWGLDGREAGLQSEGEHRAVPQLVQAVIVVPKLLHQHSPPGQVQKVLVRGNVCIWWKGQHAHHLPNLIQLTALGLAEVLPCMSHSIQSLVLADEFNKFLDPEAELQAALRRDK